MVTASLSPCCKTEFPFARRGDPTRSPTGSGPTTITGKNTHPQETNLSCLRRANHFPFDSSPSTLPPASRPQALFIESVSYQRNFVAPSKTPASASLPACSNQTEIPSNPYCREAPPARRDQRHTEPKKSVYREISAPKP